MRVACIFLMACAMLGCRTEIGPNGVEAEWGGSSVTTTTWTGCTTTTMQDGSSMTTCEKIVQESAVAEALSDNMKALLAGAIGFLIGR